MKRCIFIGQAMPRVKKHPHDWPSLNSWLYSIGLKNSQIRKYFLYSALVDYFPGSNEGPHKIPTTTEIKNERDRLIKTITNFNPEVAVPVGRLSISYCLNQKAIPLKNSVGKIFHTNPYQVLGYKTAIIPLPHPSGASTWYNKEDNKKLLLDALRLLKKSLAF